MQLADVFRIVRWSSCISRLSGQGHVTKNTCPCVLFEFWPQTCILSRCVPAIHGESYHVATDKVPSIDGGKFRSIFSDNLQPIATREKKARGTLLVDKHCCNGCSFKRAPFSVGYYNKISGGPIGRGGLFGGGVLPAPILPLWFWLLKALT